MREDLELADYARSLGFVNKSKGPNFANQYVLGEIHVWFCRQGWAVARLAPMTSLFSGHRYIPSGFSDHRYIPHGKLRDALNFAFGKSMALLA